MKRLILSVLVLLSITAVHAAQGRTYGVTVKAEKVDFAKFKTYSYTVSRPSSVKEVDAKIVAALDREFKALGMSKITTGKADVVATYYSLTRTDVDLEAKADASGARPQQSVGSLLLVLLEPGTDRRLLQLRLDKPIGSIQDLIATEVDSAVAEMFTKYPTRTSK